MLMIIDMKRMDILKRRQKYEPRFSRQGGSITWRSGIRTSRGAMPIIKAHYRDLLPEEK